MKITALIVTFNRLEKLKKCWAAVKLLDFNEIVIVNNASTDGTGEWLDEIDDPRLRVISSNINDGGAGGFYRGAEWVSKHSDGDWVLFFDDDAYPEKNLLELFYQRKHDEADAIATKVIDLTSRRCKMNIPWLKIPNTLSEIKEYRKTPALYEASGEVVSDITTFSFVGVFIKADVLKKTYLHIDKSLFVYFDDVYYSWQLRLLGYKLKYDPQLIFNHDTPASASEIAPWKIYYLVRNLLISRGKFNGNKPFSTISIILRLIKYAYNCRYSKQKINYLKFLKKGLIDGVLNIYKARQNGVG